MNLFYRSAESRNGSQKKILEKLKDNKFFEYCVLIDFSGGIDKYDVNFYTSISSSMCYLNTYEQLCNLEEISEPDIDLLNEMEKYKPTFLHIAGIRPHNMYVGDYFSLDIRYLLELRFWNYILEKYKIDVAFFACIPHWEWEYMVYALCKCKKIPTLLVYGTHIPIVSCVGTSIENMGFGTANIMREWIDTSNSLLNRYINNFLDRTSGGHSRYSDKDKKRQHNRHYYGWHKILSYKKILVDFKYMRDVRSAMKALRQSCIARHEEKGLRFYNSMAVCEIENVPFVYYALQLTPEATTLPWAGVFQNQLISIRMLSEMGRKYGFKVYVKEHFVQPGRPYDFYRELKKIPEVVLIDAYVDSYKLIQNSIANITQTGSVITESIIKGRPVISFVDSFWSGASNVYVIKSKNDLENAILDIFQRKITKEKAEVIKNQYFQALSATCIRWKLDYVENAEISDDDIAEDMVDLFGQFIKNGMTDSFIYIRKECMKN